MATHLDLNGYASPPHNPYSSTVYAQRDRGLLLYPVSKPSGTSGILPTSHLITQVKGGK